MTQMQTRLAIAAMIALAVAGCSSSRETVGASKQAPDETSVTSRAPLVVPATFVLKPPQPGAPRPQDANASVAAQRVLGGEPKATPATQGELELLQASGAQAVNPNIRQEIRHDYAKGTKRRSYADAILFWRSSEPNVATPLDARQEARRISTAGPVVPPAPVEQAPPVIEKGEVASAEPSVQEKKSADKAGNSRGWFDWF